MALSLPLSLALSLTQTRTPGAEAWQLQNYLANFPNGTMVRVGVGVGVAEP